MTSHYFSLRRLFEHVVKTFVSQWESVCVCDKPLAASRRTYTLAAMSTYHRNGFMRFIMVFWHSNWSLFSTYICVLCAMYIHNMFLLRFQFCERNNVSRHLCVVRFSWKISTVPFNTRQAHYSGYSQFGNQHIWFIPTMKFNWKLFFFVRSVLNFVMKNSNTQRIFYLFKYFLCNFEYTRRKKNEWKYTETCKINVLYEDARRLGASITFDFSHCSPSVAFSRRNGNKARTPDTCSICE